MKTICPYCKEWTPVRVVHYGCGFVVRCESCNAVLYNSRQKPNLEGRDEDDKRGNGSEILETSYLDRALNNLNLNRV